MSDSDIDASTAVGGGEGAGRSDLKQDRTSDNHARTRARERQAVAWIDGFDFHGDGPAPSHPSDLFTREAMIDAYMAGQDSIEGDVPADVTEQAAARAELFVNSLCPLPPRVSGATARERMLEAYAAGFGAAVNECATLHRDEQDQWDDERRVGQAQLDLAMAVIAEAHALIRSYEQHHSEQARKMNPGGSGRSVTPAVQDRLDKAERNRLMADRLEAVLRGDDTLPIPAPDLPLGENPATTLRGIAESMAKRVKGITGVDHAAFDQAEKELDEEVALVPAIATGAMVSAMDDALDEFNDSAAAWEAGFNAARKEAGDRAERRLDDVVVDFVDYPSVQSRKQADRLAERIRPNVRPVTGALLDPEVVEGLIAAAGGLEDDAAEAAPVRLEGVADLTAFRINTPDPRFDPGKRVCINGYLYQPVNVALQ